MGKDKAKDKEHHDGETAATSETNSPRDTHQDVRDLSRDREAWDAALAQSLKQSQGRWQRLMCTTRLFSMTEAEPPFKPALKYLQEQMVMDPFDWIKDKSIYQRWQLWSEKARLAFDAMEGDSEKTKISYFHHWINGEGMRHIESWKNSKTLISQSPYDTLENTEGKYSSECIESYFTLFELLLAPKSNPLLSVEELHFAKQGSMTSGEFHSHIVKIAKRCKFPNPEAEERTIRDAIFWA